MRRNMLINLGFVLANLALAAFLLLPRGMAAMEKPENPLPRRQESVVSLATNSDTVPQGEEGQQVLQGDGNEQQGEDRVTEEELAKVYRRLPTQEKVVALTFDDGPKKTATRKILAILEEKDVPATFFLLGSSALNQPELVRQISDAGCDIANHSWSHPDFTKISEEKLVWQIEASAVAFAAMGAEYQPYIRPPYGKMDGTVRRVSADLGYDVLLWNVDPRDWQYKDPEIVLELALTGLKPGSIVLFHDRPEATLQVLPDFIDAARAMGYEFVLISQYLDVLKIPGSEAGLTAEGVELAY